MTAKSRIFVDFMKTDGKRRLLLTTLGTVRDLREHGIALREGLVLSVYEDDVDDAGQPNNLLTDGIVRYNTDAARWVLEIDWNAIIHESDLRAR